MTSTGAPAVLARIVRNGSLRRVLFAFAAFNIAEFATWVAILLFAYDRTGPASVGIVALLQLVPAALFAAPAASLGDRFPRAQVLNVGYLVQAVAMLVTASAMIADLPVVVVYVGAAVAATSLVVTRPTQSALLPSLARTPAELTAANSAAGVMEGVGVLIGPLIAAAILTTATVAVVFGVAAAALTLAALATVGLRPADDPGRAPVTEQPPDRGADADRSFRAGIRLIARDPDARLVLSLLTTRMVLIGCVDVLFVLMAIELLGMGEPGAGLLNAALGAGTIAGGAVAFGLIDRRGLAAVAAIGAVAWGIAIGLVGLTATAALAPGLIVLGGAGLTVIDVAGRTILQRSIRDESLARVFGLQESLAMAGLAVGSLLVSVLATAFGLVATIAIVAAIQPALVLATWGRLAALDRRSAAPVRTLDLLRRTPLFGPLPAPELEAIARRGTWLTVPADTVVIREGDAGDRYYVLDAGAVRVEQGGRHLRDLKDAGDGFGEIALLRDVPRTATVTTTQPSVLFAVDRAPFLAALTGRPLAALPDGPR